MTRDETGFRPPPIPHSELRTPHSATAPSPAFPHCRLCCSSRLSARSSLFQIRNPHSEILTSHTAFGPPPATRPTLWALGAPRSSLYVPALLASRSDVWYKPVSQGLLSREEEGSVTSAPGSSPTPGPRPISPVSSRCPRTAERPQGLSALHASRYGDYRAPHPAHRIRRTRSRWSDLGHVDVFGDVPD